MSRGRWAYESVAMHAGQPAGYIGRFATREEAAMSGRSGPASHVSVRVRRVRVSSAEALHAIDTTTGYVVRPAVPS